MRSIMMGVVATLVFAACSNGGSDDSASEPSAGDAAAAGSVEQAAAVAVPDACSFMSREEMARIIGRELREGERNSQAEGLSECDFSTPPGLYVTTTYPDPALPEASGFSSVTVNTHPTTTQSFREFRDMIGSRGEDVAGVGDGAYFNGPAMLYARVGNAGFSIRLHVNQPETAGGRARLRATMLELAQLGVARLE